MLSLQITDLKKMTGLLFVSNSFDKFLLHDAQFVTAVTVTLEGRKNRDFYVEEEREAAMKEEFISWADERPLCKALLTGKRLPLSFRLVLLTSREVTAHMKSAAGFTDCEVSSLSVNFIYREGNLFLTTGIAYAGFSMDKSLEKYWDDAVRSFLDGKECGYTEL